MQKRSVIIKVAIGLCISLCACAIKKKPEITGKDKRYKALLVRQTGVDSNWGYIVLCNDRQFIRQFTVPALAGNQPFASKEAAASVAGLVLQKLKRGRLPGINKHELDSLGILKLSDEQQKN